MALIAGFLAVDQRNAARRQQQVATVGELAAASVANLPLDPELSVLLAREAVDTLSEAGVYVAEAEEALHRAVLQSRALLSTPNWDNGLAHFSPDGQRFIGLTHPTDMAIPQVWDVGTRRPVLDLVGHEAPHSMESSAPMGPASPQRASTAPSGSGMPPPVKPRGSWIGTLQKETS